MSSECLEQLIKLLFSQLELMIEMFVAFISNKLGLTA